jgi:hypothetical protein
VRDSVCKISAGKSKPYHSSPAKPNKFQVNFVHLNSTFLPLSSILLFGRAIFVPPERFYPVSKFYGAQTYSQIRTTDGLDPAASTADRDASDDIP